MHHSIGNLQCKVESLTPRHGLLLLPHLFEVGKETAFGSKLHKNEESFFVEESARESEEGGKKGEVIMCVC